MSPGAGVGDNTQTLNQSRATPQGDAWQGPEFHVGLGPPLPCDAGILQQDQTWQEPPRGSPSETLLR